MKKKSNKVLLAIKKIYQFIRTKNLRKLCQLSIFIFFMLLPVANLLEYYAINGNFLSFSLYGIPLADPLSSLQVALLSSTYFSKATVGGLFVLLFAMFMGSIFCSWICPYGFISEYCQQQNQNKVKKHTAFFPFTFLLKLGTGCLLLCLSLYFLPYPGLNVLSQPASITRFWQALAHQDYWLMLSTFLFFSFVLVLDYITKKRFWCLYLCPQSILISIVKAISPVYLQVYFTKSMCSCKKAAPCRSSCSLGLDPRRNKLSQELVCTNCKDCVKECQKHGAALSLQMRKNKFFSLIRSFLFHKK